MKKRFKKKNIKTDVALQITSMADIFTILLVFLLKSFSGDASKVTPTSQLTLPESVQGSPLEDVLKIEISSSGVLIDDKTAIELKNFQFPAHDLESNDTSRMLNLLLMKARQKEEREEQTQKEPKEPKEPKKTSTVLILSDQKTPYQTLRHVLSSAAHSGFEFFDLAFVEPQ